MSNRFRAISATLVLAAFSAIASAQQTPATTTPAAATPTTYSLKPVLKKDDSFTWTTKGTFDMQGQEIVFSAKVVQKITDVTAEGQFTTEQKQSDVKLTIGGNESPAPEDSPAITAIINPNGTTKEIKADNPAMTGAEAYRDAALDTVLIPDSPVKVGDTWTYKATAEKEKWLGTQVDFKLDSLEKIGDYDCIKITFKAKELEGDTPATGEGAVWLSVKDFSLVKREVKVANYPIPGVPVLLNGTITMTRV